MKLTFVSFNQRNKSTEARSGHLQRQVSQTDVGFRQRAVSPVQVSLNDSYNLYPS